MDAHEVIGAFVDRERVDPEALKAALATAQGRQYLVDVIALRELTTDEAPQAHLDRRDWSLTRWFSMAAAIVLTLAAGYLIGARFGAGRPAAAVPSPVMIEVTQPISAPAPTSIIRLEPGVNWKNREGG